MQNQPTKQSTLNILQSNLGISLKARKHVPALDLATSAFQISGGPQKLNINTRNQIANINAP